MASNKALRIIIDTNLFISFLITKDFSKLDRILLSEKAVLLFSEELLNELTDVVKRPKLKKYFHKRDVERLLDVIGEFAIAVQVVSEIELCRDEKDNFLLALAMDGKADYLLTGDKDLLELKTIGDTEITTLTTFLNNWP